MVLRCDLPFVSTEINLIEKPSEESWALFYVKKPTSFEEVLLITRDICDGKVIYCTNDRATS